MVGERSTDITPTLTTPSAPVPMCKDGLLRPYLITVIVDTTLRSKTEVIAPHPIVNHSQLSLKDFKRVLKLVARFVEKRFAGHPQLLHLSLLTTESESLVQKGLNVTSLSTYLNAIEQRG